MRNGSTAVAGAQVASTPRVSRAVFLSHTSRCRTMRNGSIAVAGAQVASTPSVSRAVFLSHTSRCLKELAVAVASRLRAPKLRALRAFHVQCPSLTPAGAALCGNGRHPLLLRGLPATKALPGVSRRAPLCPHLTLKTHLDLTGLSCWGACSTLPFLRIGSPLLFVQ